MASPTGRITRSFRQLKAASSTWMLFRILILIQAIPVIWNLISPNGVDRLSHLQHTIGLQSQSAIAGKIWQLISYGFIHGNWPHLLLNATAILLLGAKLEPLISKRSFWTLVIVSTLSGGLLFISSDLLVTRSLYLLPQTLVGSSAICFGFLLFLTTLSPESKLLPLFLSARTIGIAIILANLILTTLNPSLPTGPLASLGNHISENYHLPNLFKISHACHLGGSLLGLFYGKWLLRPRVSLASLKQAREKKERKSQISNQNPRRKG